MSFYLPSQPGLPVVQGPIAVVPPRPQLYPEPAIPFPIVHPTSVAPVQMRQPQPVLVSQQVRNDIFCLYLPLPLYTFKIYSWQLSGELPAGLFWQDFQK